MEVRDHVLSVDAFPSWEGPGSPRCHLNLTSQFTHYVDNGFIHQCELARLIFFLIELNGKISLANYN